MKEQLTRFSVSVEQDLLDHFDQLIATKGYTNRSEAIRDLMREYLATNSPRRDETPAVGTLTLVYDHHVRELADKLMDLQHAYHEHIISTLHVHLDHSLCMEVIDLRGRLTEIEEIAGKMTSTRGVKRGKLLTYFQP